MQYEKLLALASMLTIDMAGCDELRLPKCEQQYDANCINRHMKATREQTQDVVCYNIAAYDSGKLTPMMRQYKDMKERYRDAILF